MSDLSAAIFGIFICLVVPTLCLGAGIYIGRNGFPVEIRWRRRTEEEV